MKELKVWINGKLYNMKDAKVSVSDRGYLYGDGIFETMRSYAGVTFKLGSHLDRLFDSLKAVKIMPPYSKEYLSSQVGRLLKINRLDRAYIRVTVTRGEGKFGIGTSPLFRPNAVIVTKELDEYPKESYGRGIAIGICKTTRQNEYSPLSNLKSLNYLNYLLARIDARNRGYDEAVILNTKGDVAECAASNIFIVKRGCLITPAVESGILPGITRDAVIAIAKNLRIKVEERAVKCKELTSADEVFLTNSIAEVLPVTRIDSRKVGKGSPGGMTKLFRISYQKMVICDTMEHHGKRY